MNYWSATTLVIVVLFSPLVFGMNTEDKEWIQEQYRDTARMLEIVIDTDPCKEYITKIPELMYTVMYDSVKIEIVYENEKRITFSMDDSIYFEIPFIIQCCPTYNGEPVHVDRLIFSFYLIVLPQRQNGPTIKRIFYIGTHGDEAAFVLEEAITIRKLKETYTSDEKRSAVERWVSEIYNPSDMCKMLTSFVPAETLSSRRQHEMDYGKIIRKNSVLFLTNVSNAGPEWVSIPSYLLCKVLFNMIPEYVRYVILSWEEKSWTPVLYANREVNGMPAFTIDESLVMQNGNNDNEVKEWER